MLNAKQLLSLEFYKKSPCFTGSLGTLCYKVAKITETITDESGKEKTNIIGLRLTYWQGPFNYDNTPDDAKTSADFDFTNEGLEAIAEVINSQVN